VITLGEVVEDGLGVVGDARGRGDLLGAEAEVAVRSGRSAWTIFLMLTPVRACASRETASAANTMVRWASMLSRIRWNIGRAARSDLAIRKDRSTW
jgi:hypothetical protein